MNVQPVLPTRKLLGVRYHIINRASLYAHLFSSLDTATCGNIFNVNIHAMNIAYEDKEFHHVLNQGDLVFVDGFGVVLGAKMLGQPAGERLTMMDWMDGLLAQSAIERWPVFLLGDTDEQGEAFRKKLALNHPHCLFAGHHHGFFDKNGSENELVIEKINNSGAKILLVGMSMPIQEKWIWANQDKLKPILRIATGAFHRVYSGSIVRGPKWMTDHGFEWLCRMYAQPTTWKRYTVGNPLFLSRVGKELLTKAKASIIKPKRATIKQHRANDAS